VVGGPRARWCHAGSDGGCSWSTGVGANESQDFDVLRVVVEHEFHEERKQRCWRGVAEFLLKLAQFLSVASFECDELACLFEKCCIHSWCQRWYASVTTSVEPDFDTFGHLGEHLVMALFVIDDDLAEVSDSFISRLLDEASVRIEHGTLARVVGPEVLEYLGVGFVIGKRRHGRFSNRVGRVARCASARISRSAAEHTGREPCALR
jgi:hypothetical protein